MQCPWGQKAFTHYLGTDQTQWRQYDASELVKATQLSYPILIDQGADDSFLTTQLLSPIFAQACQDAGQVLTLRMQPGYDHSYYFIASFMADHIDHHAQALNGA